MGSIKPGRFRLRTRDAILYCINSGRAPYLSSADRLARIGTIHFAHWVVIEHGARGFFCSNYDGSHEAYMDDFINKAAFGLNLEFSNGIGYPTTNWLLARWRLARAGLQALPAPPPDSDRCLVQGLSGTDRPRPRAQRRIRNGFERAAMSDDEIRRWLAEI